MTAEIIISTFLAVEIIVDLYNKSEMDYAKRTYFEMFKENIVGFYEYTGNNTDFKVLYSFNEFTNLFYDAVCYDEELPKYVQEKFMIYFKCSEKTEFDKEYINSVLYEIRACIVQSKLDEAVKDFWIKDNERKTKKIRELIFRPHFECNSVDLVRPLITWAENHNKMTYEFIYKIFEYGYITGKRAERARKKPV